MWPSNSVSDPAKFNGIAMDVINVPRKINLIPNFIFPILLVPQISQHKGIKAFFENGSKAGIQPSHAAKLARQLRQLNDARTASDMNIPGWKWHPLSSDLSGYWSVWVNGNWRLTFAFEGEDAILVNYQDYH